MSATDTSPAPHPQLEAVLDHLERGLPQTLADLSEWVRIPGVSAEGFPPEPLLASAQWASDSVRGAGADHVEILHHGSAPPYVVGRWSGTPGSATVLVYGHHDVQPPGRLENWTSPPWEPVQRDGRLYGRGVVDDKAGVMCHLAALHAWTAVTGTVPLNVKLLIEGEEEVGSPHLEDFLNAHREPLAADCLILSDTCNLDVGIPALTTSLRGLVVADVTTESLTGPLHSGIWGGPIPDPVQALAKILAGLTDAAGHVTIPGIARGPQRDTTAIDPNLPFDTVRFREQGGVLDDVPLTTADGPTTYAASWRDPVVTISAIDAEPLATSSNQILPRATARVGVRLAPDQDANSCLAALVTHLQRDPPWGCRVTVHPHTAADGWQTTPVGPYFEAARTALAAGYGHPAVYIGCGGSIPFVGPFAQVMGDIPALLLGLEDPACRAHGENESLHLEDFRKACRAAVHLYAHLAAVPPPH